MIVYTIVFLIIQKLFSVIGNQFEFIDVEEALRISLESFLEGKQCFRYISPKSEAILDRSAKIVGGLSIFSAEGKSEIFVVQIY